MYKLYSAAGSGAFGPHAVLGEAAVAFEIIDIDLGKGEHRAPQFLAINPAGQVPVLILQDGSTMTESAAMMLHLADSHPQAGLLPPPGDPDRAAAYRWMFFGSANLYETELRIEYSDRYTSGDPAPVKQRAGEQLDEAWKRVAQSLGEEPYMLGDMFSVVDIYVAMFSQWHADRAALFSRHPAVRELTERVRQRTALAPIWRAHFG